MSDENLRVQLRDLILEISELDELPETKSFQELGIDSMMGVEIVAAIERKYGIKIDESELEQVSTLASSIALVERKVAQKSLT